MTADAIALCVKSGNAVILKGGREALHSNKAVSDALIAAGRKAGLPEGAVQFINIPEREAVTELIHLDGLVDVVIPRGGAGLIRTVVSGASVPVIETGSGVCHTYVDKKADVAMAVSIASMPRSIGPVHAIPWKRFLSIRKLRMPLCRLW